MQAADRKIRMVAAGTTALVVLAVVLVLLWCHISLQARPPVPERPTITLSEEFIEVLDDRPMRPDMAHDKPATAKANEQKPSQPTPVSGTDIHNQGKAGDPAPVVADNKQPDPAMTVKNKPDPKPKGPSEEELKRQQEEEIKRQANNEIADAFNRSKGKHNNATSTSDQGNNGKPQGQAPQGSLSGTGKGTVGGGWSIPAYASVPSTLTGSIKLTVKIDREGRVTSLAFTGGDAPAATNSALRRAVEAEVRSKRFTRPRADDAPETSTAYITYTFR